ncbi:MAG: ParB N-terminal domain-containing protein [Prevotella sp.]|jgi:hypothetical protein|nr:ParB N-terminal domain-containing protein [Prevotella sp.]
MENNLGSYRVDNLYFDIENPRLVEFHITSATPENEILNILWAFMAVDEIVMSILAHGFFEHEPIFAVQENGKFIVVEGNRRLAAVKSILHPDMVEKSRMEKFVPKITQEKVNVLNQGIPVIVLRNREEAWRYIGFKHVNGAAKWGSYAKAQYIASVHDRYGKSLDEIAEQIGDANNTVKKLYQGLMVIKEAERYTSFQSNNTYSGRIFFSHLYTAIGYESFKKYLGLELHDDGSILIPSEKKENLQNVMTWLYGVHSENIQPVIKTQNPDLRYLDAVLASKEATVALQDGSTLNEAYEIARGGSEILMTSLIRAKMAIQKALANSSYYNGDEETLRIAGTIANSADNLYDTFDKKHSESNPQKSKRMAE